MRKLNLREQKLQIRNNYDYLHLIRKNHMALKQQFRHSDTQKQKIVFKSPISSFKCESTNRLAQGEQESLPTFFVQTLQNETPDNQISSNICEENITKNSGKYRYKLKSMSINQQEKGGTDNDKCLTYDMLLQILHNKNQQIAESLLKERQSVPGLVCSRSPYKPKSFERLPNHNLYSERKGLIPQVLPQPFLKFPQLVKKRIVYGITSDIDFKIEQKKLIQKKPSIAKIQQVKVVRNYKSVDEEHEFRSERDIVQVEQDHNRVLDKGQNQNKSIVHLRQQPYTTIPQFQPPRKKTGSRDKKKKPKHNIYPSIRKSQTGSQNHLQNFLYSKIIKKALVRRPSKIVINGNDELFDNHDLPDSNQHSNNSNTQSLEAHNAQNHNTEKDKDEIKELQQEQQNKEQDNLQKQAQLQIDTPVEVPLESPTKAVKKLSQFSKSKSKQNFLAAQKQKDTSVYQGKIRSYRQFLFQMNLVHRKFDSLALKEEQSLHRVDIKYKYYVGKGNNSLLIKSLMKRRFWWIPQQDPKKANFVWTQLKLNYLYQFQPRIYLDNPYDKLEVENEESIRKKLKKNILHKKDGGLSPTRGVKAGIFKAPMSQGLGKIMTLVDQQLYNGFMQNADFNKISNFDNRLKYFPPNLLQTKQPDKTASRVHNHFQFNYFIGNKKALFYNLKQYYQLIGKNLSDIIPMTFHLHNANGPEYAQFFNQFKNIKQTTSNSPNKKHNKSIKACRNVWIVKPGELSNRGMGITVIDQIYELNNILKRKQKHHNGSQKTYIVQKYIERPMLYNRRKFDIRHYMVISRLYGRMRVYWYSEGYLRTSCYEYRIQQIDNEYMHLTNDAIQKQAYGYGKYEQANKVSYNQFQRYLDSTYPDKKYSFADKIYPRMKQIAIDAVNATYLKIDPSCYQSNFQVFGLDFMIDNDFNVLLIQVNTNPCLEINCSLLNRVIPTMLQHCFRLTLDVLFPPPNHYPNSVKYLCPDSPMERMQYELIFDSARDGIKLHDLYQNTKQVEIRNIESDDQTYDNDGNQLDLQGDID